jgi:transposase
VKKQRKHYTAEEKVAILRRHLLEQEAVSKLCDELGLQPTVFYRWQKEFFENGAAAFQAKARSDHQAEQERIEFLQKKIQRKDEVLAEFLFPQNNLMAVKPDYPCELMTRVNAEIGLPAEIASLIAEMLSSVPERRPQWKHIESTLRAVHACPRLRDLPKMPARLQVVTPELDSSLLDGLYRFIMATSDCSRSDRLFPADPKVFTTNSLSLAYGAAGVLSAVNYSGYAVPSSAVEWLLSRLKECPASVGNGESVQPLR